jgi:hypothetical protein
MTEQSQSQPKMLVPLAVDRRRWPFNFLARKFEIFTVN